MTAVNALPSLSAVVQSLLKQAPFNRLEKDEQSIFFAEAKLFKCELGQRILRSDTLPDRIYLVLSGTVRFLAETSQGSRTLDRRGSGQMLGWVSLFRAEPCEWVIASEETVLLAIPSATFVACLEANNNFCREFANLNSRHELDWVLSRVANADVQLSANWRQNYQSLADTNSYWVASVPPGEMFLPPEHVPESAVWMLSLIHI